ncbi:hypothetical protein AGMMS50229_06340 [Campylobacterota bacterium]|nr:hypothetical protein AGMMS50229_06340 [Campylobacterota bacterium]
MRALNFAPLVVLGLLACGCQVEDQGYSYGGGAARPPAQSETTEVGDCLNYWNGECWDEYFAAGSKEGAGAGGEDETSYDPRKAIVSATGSAPPAPVVNGSSVPLLTPLMP